MSHPTALKKPAWRGLLIAGCLALGFVAAPLRAEDAKPAEKPAEPARPGGQGGGGPAQFLKMSRERLNALNLTDEQKTKIDAIYASAEGDAKGLADADPQERRQKFRELMTGVREKVAAVLTDEQKKKLEEMGPGRGGPGGAGGPIARLEENLGKLDLSDDQKTKVKPVVDAAKKKFEELRGELQGGDRQAMREKFRATMDETRDKLKEILTPEQAEKLKGLMEAGRPGGAGGPGGPPRGDGVGTPPPPKPADK